MNNIIISGPDGVGKSTISKHLIWILKKKDMRFFQYGSGSIII